MKKELLFAAIAQNAGINKWTDILMYCGDAGDNYNDVDCKDCLVYSSCCIIPDETLNSMKILQLQNLWNTWYGKAGILHYAKMHIGVDSEDDTKLLDCYETKRAACTNCKFNKTTPWCSHKEKEKFFLQFE